jgi:hypothetical protein
MAGALETTSPPPDFFISYTGIDKDWAEKLAWWLEDAGYTVIIQAWDFRPGHNFPLMMDRALRAKHTIAVLSPSYLEASYCQQEWAAVLADDPRGEHRKLIPVRVKPCQPNGMLRAVIYVDLVKRKRSRQYSRLRFAPGVTSCYNMQDGTHVQ